MLFLVIMLAHGGRCSLGSSRAAPGIRICAAASLSLGRSSSWRTAGSRCSSGRQFWHRYSLIFDIQSLFTLPLPSQRTHECRCRHYNAAVHYKPSPAPHLTPQNLDHLPYIQWGVLTTFVKSHFLRISKLDAQRCYTWPCILDSFVLMLNFMLGNFDIWAKSL